MQMCKSLTQAALAALLLLGLNSGASAIDVPTYGSATEAYRQGVAALKKGQTEAALPALDYAAERGVLGAQLKLARVYANGNGVEKDDSKAFAYYRQIANQRADISAASPVSKYVAEAFVALGRYYVKGIEASAVQPDPRRAAGLFRHAGSIFGSAEAQYELAKLYLDGAGVEKNVGLAINWLATAAKKQHAAAQATLGEILWRGEDTVRQRPARGIALIMLAHANGAASGKEPQWIADLYLEALASSDRALLKEAMAMTGEWGGPPITIDLVPEPAKTVLPGQLLVPATEAAPPAQTPPAAASAGTVVSEGAVPPAAQMGVPVGFGPAGNEPSGLKP
jgi:TPR repeat protein